MEGTNLQNRKMNLASPFHGLTYKAKHNKNILYKAIHKKSIYSAIKLWT